MHALIRYILLFPLFLGLSCSLFNDPSDEDINISYFNGKTDGVPWKGDGLAFYRIPPAEDQVAIHFRGVTGSYEHYFQIDIIVSDSLSGRYALPLHYAGMVELAGGRSPSLNNHKSKALSTDFVEFVWDKERERITGNFKFQGVSSDSSKKEIEGEFSVKTGGYTLNWSCGFTSKIPTDKGCDFDE